MSPRRVIDAHCQEVVLVDGRDISAYFSLTPLDDFDLRPGSQA
jgi:hypothetical protein